MNMKKMTALILGAVMSVSASSAAFAAIQSVDDLEGSVIGVQMGTTGDIYASDYEGDEAGTKVERFSKGAQAVMALMQGKVDCVIIDAEPAKKFVEANEGLVILEEPFETEEYAIAVSKDRPELTEAINGALAQLKENGTLDNITKTISATTPWEPFHMNLRKAWTVPTELWSWLPMQRSSRTNSMTARPSWVSMRIWRRRSAISLATSWRSPIWNSLPSSMQYRPERLTSELPA